MSPAPLGKPPGNLHSPFPAAPSLESLLTLIGGVSSAEDLDTALRTARRHHAGSMMEQLQRGAAVRAHFLLENLDEASGG